jgi:hypothetical protein
VPSKRKHAVVVQDSSDTDVEPMSEDQLNKYHQTASELKEKSIAVKKTKMPENKSINGALTP